MQLNELVNNLIEQNEKYPIVNFSFTVLLYIWFGILIILILDFKKQILNKTYRILLILILIGLSIPVYANNIERFWITKKENTFKIAKNKDSIIKARFAVFSDIHLGLFKDERFATQVIKEVNNLENIDAVLVPGDLTYEPRIEDLARYFAPFKDSKYPIIMVLGNHDLEKPGPKIRKELEKVLIEVGVTLIDDKDINIKGVNIYGLQDKWISEYSTNIIKDLKPNQINLVLAHQPDVVRDYDTLNIKPDLTITGHTHCGQVRIPYLYNKHLPTVDNYYDKGLYQTNNGQLYITCGVGEVGLPIRLFNPPVIDIINIQN